MNEELYQLFDDAKRNYKESGADYEAGIVEGLKRALEIIENETTLERDIREENERQKDSGDC